MGRKVELKKIENTTKCQVTFSKRRSSLIRKAHELSVFCDVDVSFVAFSPSGRLSKFSSLKRVEDVLERYVNLPADKRYCHIMDIEEKLEKLHELDYIKGDRNKLHHLDKQIEHMERQIKTADLELQIYEANLRDFEPDPHHEPSLAQLLWCERNLKNSLNRIIMENYKNQGGAPFSYNFDGKEPMNWTAQNPSKLLMHLDPWISPYSSRVRDSILQDLLGPERKKISQDTELIGVSDDYTSNLPNGFQSMQHKMEIPPSALETHSPPSSTLPQQAMQRSCAVPVLNQRVGIMFNGSFMGMLGNDKPSGHRHEVVTPDQFSSENNLNMLDGTTPNFHLNTNNEQPNCFTTGNNHNLESQNMDVIAPAANHERILSDPLVPNPLFTPIATNTTIKINNNNNNNDGSNDQEDAMWAERNKEVDDLSWFWDGFVFPENLKLEDLDIPY